MFRLFIVENVSCETNAPFLYSRGQRLILQRDGINSLILPLPSALSFFGAFKAIIFLQLHFSATSYPRTIIVQPSLAGGGPKASRRFFME